MKARRLVLGVVAAAGVAAPWLGACSAQFDPPSRIEGVRVLAVTVDEPYSKPGATVNFDMTWDAAGAFAGAMPQILWLGGCFDPPQDTYYGCYQQFADLFAAIQNGEPPDPRFVGLGDHFQLELPSTFITDHPPPATGSNYGVAYVFFAVCTGQLQVVPPGDAGGPAGSFPLGCFDEDGNPVGADGFVPGFTQVYAFADGRENPNPPAKGLRIKRPLDPDVAYAPLPTKAEDARVVEKCGVSEDDRRKLGCGNDPFAKCTPWVIDVDVDATVSNVDPGSVENGKTLHEAVWIDWYTDGGDFDADVSLVYDPHEGLVPDRSVQWIAPTDPGTYSIWGVVHDARGGTRVLEGFLEVK